MRHFRDELRGRGFNVDYRELGAHAEQSLGAALAADLGRLRPERVVVVQPGEHRVAQELAAVAHAAGIPLEILPDDHFFVTPQEFADWARNRRELRLKHFCRWMRRRTGVLMDGAQPAGGRWNFDADNRSAFGAAGPGLLPAPLAFPRDAITREVVAQVERELARQPRAPRCLRLAGDARAGTGGARGFRVHRLPLFGRWQDAMWRGEPWLYHSHLSAALNHSPSMQVPAGVNRYGKPISSISRRIGPRS